MGKLTKRHKIFLGTGLAVCVLLGTQHAFAQARDPCFDFADPIRVIVGGTEFRLPAAYDPYLYDTAQHSLKKSCRCRNRETGEIRYSYCQTTDEPPLAVWGLTINPSHFQRAQRIIPDGFPHLSAVQLSLRTHAGDAFEQYCAARRSSETQVIRWDPYDSNPTFQIGASSSSSPSAPFPFYLRSNEARAFGLPILIGCDKERPNELGFSCSFSHPVSATLSVWVRFRWHSPRPEDWGPMIAEVEGFTRHIASGRVADNDSQICTALVEDKHGLQTHSGTN